MSEPRPTDEQRKLLKYFELLDDAWKNLLKDFGNRNLELLDGIEGPVRGYLFAECLRLMREAARNFEKPYRIWENESFMEGAYYPDITLGSLGENRLIAIEIKIKESADKVTKQEVEDDIRKLDVYLQHAVCSVFFFIDTSHRYREALDLQSLGIKKDCWEWQTVTREGVKYLDALKAWKIGET